MPSMLVTAAVFQEPMSWLNAAQDWNMKLMLVTAAVFQPAMRASLNSVQK